MIRDDDRALVSGRRAELGKAQAARPGPHLPLAAAIQIDRACARFENAWRAGQPISIEAVLEDPVEAGPDRSGLLVELLGLELELRQEAGEPFSIARYHERFPEHADLVTRALAELEGGAR